MQQHDGRTAGPAVALVGDVEHPGAHRLRFHHRRPYRRRLTARRRPPRPGGGRAGRRGPGGPGWARRRRRRRLCGSPIPSAPLAPGVPEGVAGRVGQEHRRGRAHVAQPERAVEDEGAVRPAHPLADRVAQGGRLQQDAVDEARVEAGQVARRAHQPGGRPARGQHDRLVERRGRVGRAAQEGRVGVAARARPGRRSAVASAGRPSLRPGRPGAMRASAGRACGRTPMSRPGPNSARTNAPTVSPACRRTSSPTSQPKVSAW